MGDFFLGGVKNKGNVPLLNPEQEQALSGMLANMGPQANQALMGLLQGGTGESREDLFQKTFIDPAMLAYEQQALPAIQQRFADANAGSSSALNQALAASARDVSTLLGSQMGQFMQNQQQLEQGGQLGALGTLNQGIGQRAFEPLIQQRQGVLGPMIGAGGQAAMGFFGGRGQGGQAAQPVQAAQQFRPWF